MIFHLFILGNNFDTLNFLLIFIIVYLLKINTTLVVLILVLTIIYFILPLFICTFSVLIFKHVII